MTREPNSAKQSMMMSPALTPACTPSHHNMGHSEKQLNVG